MRYSLKKQIRAFTLAETLITLVIIGIVSAITVPAVMNNINSKQKEEKVRNVYHKLSKSTDKMLGLSGMNGYSSTEDFLNHFRNHLSIAKICKPDKIQDCWGSKTVNLGDGKKYDISNLSETIDLRISRSKNPGFIDVMGFVMNDGTPFIVSYNTKCDMSLSDGKVWLADKSSSTNCLAGVFDYNGGKKPNKLGDDVLNFNASSGLGSKCSFEVNGSCYMSPQPAPSPMNYDECMSKMTKLGLSYCRGGGNDYYARAAEMCGGKQNIISSEDLTKIANEIYGMKVNEMNWTYCDNNENCKNNDLAIQYGLGTGTTSVWAWTSSEEKPNGALRRWFNPTNTENADYSVRHYSDGLVICKGD